MERHPEGLIEGSGVAGEPRSFPSPHKIHVQQEDTYGVICIWCECLEGGLRTVFEDEGLPALLIFLEHHSRLPLTS